jgi:TM2 domain-containing membrane protein YozV
MSKETDPFLMREIEERRRASEEYRKKQRYYHCKSCYRAMVVKMDKEHQEREDEEHQKKNPRTASLLSILCPGAGQAYNGQIGKGIGFFIAYLISWLSGWLTLGGMDIRFALPIIWVWSSHDAYQTAKRINKVG